MENTKKNPLKEKSYIFALEIVLVTQRMFKMREFVLGRQLLKSGTSVGANIEEANQAESKRDFIHKLSISYKEANETDYWLRLLKDSKILDAAEAEKLLMMCKEIERLLTAILKTSKLRYKKEKPGQAPTAPSTNSKNV